MKTLLLLAALATALPMLYQEPEDHKAGRGTVKLALDGGAKDIPKEEQPTTIEEIKSIPRPKDLADDLSTNAHLFDRIAPFETTKWTVEVTIKQIVRRSDEDYYLVAEDEKGKQLVMECPEPKEVKASPFYWDIEKARRLIRYRLHPTDEMQNVSQRAKVIGLGFFAKAKPGDNGARLQPVLDVIWR